MALATLSHIPAQHHSTSTSTTSSNTSTSTSSSSSRWRKGLALFQKSRSKCWSPMTLAAATEKYVRHKSTEVKCEDLTAREFAQLTGIKIIDATVTSPPMASMNEVTTLSADSTSSAACQRPHIWDSDFWQCGQPQQEQEDQQEEQEHRYHQHHHHHHNRHHHRHHHHHHRHHQPPNPRVIMKGRFKIMMGEDDEEDQESNMTAPMRTTRVITTALNENHTQVVEWKRKRSA
ncbi:hypothetical protein BDA99DRAFT_564857 [Phascolomyces articulosus]|uniref:Uncharacterized protein n=1 Tax=Phascolomyces articulosus TaxID=60185 RepID=A0AAD5JYR4_9FUNG|nr:hypothetical protein BDA99DRAFT_564857 [Phascolomyces articulosus]